MPFDDVYGYPKPSGVAAAAATAADVARSVTAYASVVETPEPQHADETRYGWRQKPDVGEGWRELGPDDILRYGDECDIGANEPRWMPTQQVGRSVADSEDRFRRRVTPESKHVVVPAASTPLEAMPLPASQVTHGNGYRQNNPDAGDAWRDVRSE